MTALVKRTEVKAAFLDACRAELAALKPGNVHAYSPGHGMQIWHFERSAEAAAPHISDPALPVGARIWRAMEATFAIAGCNTNLGILLLTAPLARAADTDHPGATLRDRLRHVLDTLDLDDAREAFRAIALANPAGLGHVDVEDVAKPPSMTLRAAMALAAERDRISRAYVTGYADIFERALPRLASARALASTQELAVTTLHMSLLAMFEDSHIARKHGTDAASAVKLEAIGLRRLYEPVATADGIGELLAFDRDLKDRGLNPGATADFVVATLFAEGLTHSTDRKTA